MVVFCRSLSPESRTADQKLGAQIFSKAAEWFQDELMAKDPRYINDIPSAIKIYHSLASVILTQTPERSFPFKPTTGCWIVSKHSFLTI